MRVDGGSRTQDGIGFPRLYTSPLVSTVQTPFSRHPGTVVCRGCTHVVTRVSSHGFPETLGSGSPKTSEGTFDRSQSRPSHSGGPVSGFPGLGSFVNRSGGSFYATRVRIWTHVRRRTHTRKYVWVHVGTCECPDIIHRTHTSVQTHIRVGVNTCPPVYVCVHITVFLLFL